MLDNRQLVCSSCGNQIEDDNDIFAPRHGAVSALRNVVVQEYADGEVVFVPGWLCESCAKRRSQELLH